MTDLSVLGEFVIILAAAVSVVVLLRRFRIPSIAGFIAAGALVGPNALGLVADIHHVEIIATFIIVDLNIDNVDSATRQAESSIVLWNT